MNLLDKDFKLVILNIFKELKKGMRTNGLPNIEYRERLKLFLKKEPNINSGVEKYNNSRLELAGKSANLKTGHKII